MRATSPTTRLASSASAGAPPPCTTISYSPAQVPLNLSPFTQITLHTLSQTQSTRASCRSRWRPGWGQRERNSAVGAERMISSRSPTCSKFVCWCPKVVALPVFVAPKSMWRSVRGRPRARLHCPPAVVTRSDRCSVVVAQSDNSVITRGDRRSIRAERVGMVCSGIGWARFSRCVGVAGLLSREATTALSREVTDAPGYVGGGRRPINCVVRASGLKRASAMAARAAAGRGAVGARVAVWEGTRPG
jgi:hypothetical protein